MPPLIDDDDDDELQFLDHTVRDSAAQGGPSYAGQASIPPIQRPQSVQSPYRAERPPASSFDVPRYNRDGPFASDTDNDKHVISETVSETEFAHSQHASNHMTVDLPPSTLATPRSLAVNFEPPATCVGEDRALTDLLQHIDAAAGADIEIELSDFSIYVDAAAYPNQLRSLHFLATSRQGHSCMYFDGVLSVEDIRYFVRKVPFRELPVGNYGSETDTVGDQIWIRSHRNERGGRFRGRGNPPVYHRRENIYYRLMDPSIEYSRYYEPFLWVANLGKHFVDFCQHNRDEHRPVSIYDFKSSFSNWLQATHGASPSFQKWHAKLGSCDYRASIVANVEYIWKEACSILPREAPNLDVFREIYSFKRFIPVAELGENEIQETVVTPYIYRCFGHMKVGTLLKPVEPSTTAGRPEDIDAPKLEPQSDVKIPGRLRRGRLRDGSSIKPGDVISTRPDAAESGTKWKAYTASNDQLWYALVQKISTTRRGSRVFEVIWLYHPCDTPCGAMKYPWDNELFLSNHCTCEEGKGSNIKENDVLGIHTVEWFGGPTTSAEFFVRQMYLSDDRRWVTLKKEHLVCDHSTNKSPGYRSGDTVLVSVAPGELLQPFIVRQCYTHDGKDWAHLQRLLRRHQFDRTGKRVARPNELTLVFKFTTVEVSKIVGRCLVRAFAKDETIPTPYDGGGVGTAFCLTYKQIWGSTFDDTAIVPVEPGDALPFHQGFDPTKPYGLHRRLRGLDLFCGCGNLGRGLEDGGAVDVRWANDIWDKALHTHMANARSPDAIRPFLGPVDELLRRALKGKFSRSVPSPGEVDFISGGSPCPGFSLLTNDRTTLKQVKNRSLVASFASFVDFYRPKYGVLENVVTMVPKSGRPEDLFSQLICALVGMGYQTEIMLGRAWWYGAPQSRDRVFLYFAAPGLRLPAVPRPSHCDVGAAQAIKRLRLGTLSNDEPFVAPTDDEAAFRIVTAKEATADLPDIGDAQVDICVPFPDHRLAGGVTNEKRPQIINIPTQPYGMSFAKAWDNGRGVMTPAERDCYPYNIARVERNSKAWTRDNPKYLFSTITTTCAWSDARVGRALHWQQQRPITLMEARRAQGMPDSEVLLGRTREQWRMVGNAVARQVAVALGLAFREAWFGSLYEGDEDMLLLDSEEDEPRHSASPSSAPGLVQSPPPPITRIEDSDSDSDVILDASRRSRGSRRSVTGSSGTTRFPVLSNDSPGSSADDVPPQPPSKLPTSRRSASRSTPGSVALVSLARATETPVTSESEANWAGLASRAGSRSNGGLRTEKKRPASRSITADTPWKRSRSELSPDADSGPDDTPAPILQGKSVFRLPVIEIDD